jgi:uncharacterized SAM-dependent methyltransferase
LASPPQITYLDEYYLTNCEIDVLRRFATDMASKIPDGAVVVELGSGFVLTALVLHAFLLLRAIFRDILAFPSLVFLSHLT